MDLLKQLTLWLASGTEAAAALIIAIAAIEATLRSLSLFVRRSARDPTEIEARTTRRRRSGSSSAGGSR